MTDTSFSEDEVIPLTVSNVPVVKFEKDLSLEFGNNSVETLDGWHDDDYSIQPSFEMDVENEEVQPLDLCTEINNNVEFDEDMEVTAIDEFNSDLKTFLDNTCDAMREEWEGELIFPAFIGNIYKEKCNILQFVGDINKKYSPFEVSFCNEKFPVSDIGIKQLTKDLQNASIINGYNLVRNGHRIYLQLDANKLVFVVIVLGNIMVIFKNDSQQSTGKKLS